MSERKVLTKYYPPDFDPSSLTRRRTKPKQAGPVVQVVRLMAPMSMRCMRCGEYIYKGRKFNARKESPDEKYLGIQIYRFYIRCTRCSAEIIFRTDPKNQDYAIVSGAKRNIEPWHQSVEETDEQRLDRLEAEEAEAAGEAVADQNRMEELEAKTLEAKREMDVADALDEIRTRNARIARADHRDHLEAVALARPADEEERQRQQDREDEEAARQAFAAAAAAAATTPAQEAGAVDGAVSEDDEDGLPSWLQNGKKSDSGKLNGGSNTSTTPSPPAAPEPASMAVPSFKRQVKKKKDHAALLGIKKKPALV
ncbi:mRNA splicing protein yju2 [Niveomyces insectorum RCEF 264]|uniref:Splicing factor YJU2 n=1 Tax=Niveomyces insectorum RCEF 264 TaxID=1081102 RepID=A0A167Z3U6_9HYPO|nr:mRNA splicing protein yju2 [Niveomyces insectorum RCEF 264]